MSNKSQADRGQVRNPIEARPVLMQERSYFSNALGRRQDYACFVPEDVEYSGLRYPLLVLLHGVSGGWRDWGRHTRLVRYLKGLDVIVVCPDLGSGWLTNAVSGGE